MDNPAPTIRYMKFIISLYSVSMVNDYTDPDYVTHIYGWIKKNISEVVEDIEADRIA